MKRKFLWIFLLAALSLTSCNEAKASSSVSASSSSDSASSVVSSAEFTQGETYKAAATIASNAVRDGMDVSTESLLRSAGYKGGESLTKTRAFNLFYQAYKDKMPEKIGARSYTAYVMSTPYADVPAEANDAVKFLMNYGLLDYELDSAGQAVTAFNGDEVFSEALMKTYLSRFHAYVGVSKVDDFCMADNYEFAYTNEAFKNKTPDDGVYDTHLVSQSNINSWVLNKQKELPVSNEKTSIDSFQTTYYDSTRRAAKDCCGAYNAYESILNTTSYSELFDCCASLFKAQGVDPLFSKTAMYSEIRIGTKITGMIDSYTPTPYIGMDLSEGSSAYTSTSDWFKTVFSGVGFDETTSSKYSASVTKAIAAMTEYYQNNILAKSGTDTFDIIMTDSLFGPQNFSLNDHLTKAGITLKPFAGSEFGADANKQGCRFIVRNNGSFDSFFGAMSDDLLDGFKAIVLYNEINSFFVCNPLSVAQAFNENYTNYDYLSTTSMLPDDYIKIIENTFIKAYRQTASYRNNFNTISKCITDVRSTFRSIIANNTWLSEAGKKAAYAKIDNVRTSILANNDDGYGLDDLTSSFTQESLYKNLCLSRTDFIKYCMNHDGTLPFFEVQNIGDHFEANAFYTQSQNGITILLGYLAAHGDFYSMDKEQLFSDLYLACGHELAHGFDTSGVTYDEYGKTNPNWLSSEDLAKYNAKVNVVKALYQGVEVMPGKPTNGSIVISEACADCAGSQIVMKLAKEVSNFDYQKFFTYVGQTFYTIISRSVYSHYETDVHPMGRARVNCLLQSMPEFYTAFNIKEGDGMYVAPEARPQVW